MRNFEILIFLRAMRPDTFSGRKKSEIFGVKIFFLEVWGRNRKSDDITFRSESPPGLSKFLDQTDNLELRTGRKTPTRLEPHIGKPICKFACYYIVRRLEGFGDKRARNRVSNSGLWS